MICLCNNWSVFRLGSWKTAVLNWVLKLIKMCVSIVVCLFCLFVCVCLFFFCFFFGGVRSRILCLTEALLRKQ